MKPVIAILLSAAALATTSGTMAQTAPVTASASVQAGTYTVDSYHTLVQFGVTHFGINEFFGTFPGTTGSLKIDPRDLSATVLDVNV
ncbi:MAG: YceI family protein, partial [Tsuneonella sp.]